MSILNGRPYRGLRMGLWTQAYHAPFSYIAGLHLRMTTPTRPFSYEYLSRIGIRLMCEHLDLLKTGNPGNLGGLAALAKISEDVRLCLLLN